MTSLRTRMTEDMQIRNLAVHTQNTDLKKIRAAWNRSFRNRTFRKQAILH